VSEKDCFQKPNLKFVTIIIVLSSLMVFEASAEPTKKDYRVNARLPLGEALPKERLYDGWKINGDIFFYNRMVKSLNYIKKNCPEAYMKGKANVKVWNQTEGGSWTNSVGGVWMGSRDWNWTQFGGDDWFIATIVHEIQHNVRGNSSEGAANWAALHYGRELKTHPALLKYIRGFSIRHGYSASDWAEHEK